MKNEELTINVHEMIDIVNELKEEIYTRENEYKTCYSANYGSLEYEAAEQGFAAAQEACFVLACRLENAMKVR